MICPKCKAEYRAGFWRCADCDVDLVADPGPEALIPHQLPTPGDPNEDPFCSFWKGEDPRVHAELCAVLDEAGIPHNSVFRRDHLFNLRNYAAYEVGVPFSLYERAEHAVKEAYGEDVEDVGSAQWKNWVRERRKLPEMLTPRSEENIPGPAAAPTETGWFPEDATIHVWSAGENETPDFLVASLHENGIRCRVEQATGRASVYVSAEDEERAREIVREVVEAKPPE